MQLSYLEFNCDLSEPCTLAPHAAVIGRTTVGAGLTLRDYATLRADGERISIGANAFFGERATVHIADGVLAATIGNDVTVGRFGLVHACTVGDGVVVGEAAVVTDGAVVGAYSLVAADSLVPPRKILPGGWLYAGNPAQPVREIARDELAAAAEALRAGKPFPGVTSSCLPPLAQAPFLPEGVSGGPVHAWSGRTPRIGRAYIAPNSVVVGAVDVADAAGIYFGCAVAAADGRIVIGPRSNVQDNSILATDRQRGDLVIGSGVTIGHNVQLGSASIGDDALVGMGARVGDEVVVEKGGCIAAGAWVLPGTVVSSGWVWAGRPARAFRELSASERGAFAEICNVYVGYSEAYLGKLRTRS
jgi:carbonic anhydrase/acetyltransferase-like protein (isoleucine patch superfamily)